MNFTYRNFFMAACVAAGLSQTANASEATAFLDWSQLEISVTGPDGTIPGVTFSGQMTSLGSTVSIPERINENHPITVFDWTSPVDTTAQGQGSSANAMASATALSGRAEAVTSPSTQEHHPIEALASGSRSENFSFDGPGTLTVSIPYTISIEGGMPFNFFNAASATVGGNASFNGASVVDTSFSVSSFEEDAPRFQSGNLVFDIITDGAGTGTLGITFNLSTQAPVNLVPEPESYAMLLAGLGLIGSMVRRRKMMEMRAGLS